MKEREPWAGEFVGRMFVHRVSQKELAEELGVSRQYVTMLLNGKRKPYNREERLNEAFAAILERRTNEQRV